VIGRVGGNHIRVAIDGSVVVDEAVATCEHVWSTAIERYFDAPRQGGAGL
jgi:hypothetical protein